MCIRDRDDSELVELKNGSFFGEMGLIAGRRRTATVVAKTECFLVETPRRAMLKLISSVPGAKKVLDTAAIYRQIQTHLTPNIEKELLKEIVDTATIESVSAGDKLISEGDESDHMFIIRSGSMTVSKVIGGRSVILSYIPSGNYVGEMALLNNEPRSASVTATVASEVIKIDAVAFRELLGRENELKQVIEEKFQDRIVENLETEDRPEAGDIIDFLVGQGVGEASDVLLSLIHI